MKKLKIQATSEYITTAVINLQNEFVKNHELKINDKQIRVGRSNSLSYIFERELACSLHNKFPNYAFLVDYPITLCDKTGVRIIKNGKKVPIIYPDILIVDKIELKNKKEGVIEVNVVALLDLKIDLGFINLDNYGISYKKKKYTAPKINSSKNLKREKYLNSANRVKFNWIVGAYSDNEKEYNKKYGDIYGILSDSIEKISIVCTRENDHGRVTIYDWVMKTLGYKVIFLLDQNHPNVAKGIENEIRKEMKSKSPIINEIFSFLK
jgi:hypothetical protein